MNATIKTTAMLICVLTAFSLQALAEPELYDTNCKIETYASFSSAELGAQYFGSFGNDGNLYIGFKGTTDQNYRNGSIAQISPTEVNTRWSNNLTDTKGVVWGGGSAYGDYIYAAELASHKISRIDSNGNRVDFATINSSPAGLGIDKYGNYGGLMYASATGRDGIFRISESGNVSQFGTFPGTISGGGCDDIEFSPTDKYGGKMFIGMHIYSGPNMYLNGIYSMDSQGKETRFAPSIKQVTDMAFDTVGTQFDNDLFIIGSKEGVAGSHVWRIDESGNASLFASFGVNSVGSITFGMDGAMYVGTQNRTISDYESEIFRISEVPEPATLGLFAIGGLLLRRKR